MAGSPRIMRLTNDFVFTATFGEAEHPERVEGMLEAFLESDIHVDKLVTHLQLEPDMPDDKYGVVDILATLENGDLAQIEMQVYWFRFMPERELFYASDLIYKQLKSGQPYDKLHRVILICIVMHDYVPSISDRFHTDFMLREKNQPDVVFSDKLQIKILDLRKFLKQYPWAADKSYVPDLPTLNAMGLEAQWMLLLITESKEVREMLGHISPPFDSAVRKVAALEASPDAWERYSYREKAARDLDAMRRDSEALGFERGSYQNARMVAQKMIARNKPLDEIMDFSGLPLDEINQLMAGK